MVMPAALSDRDISRSISQPLPEPLSAEGIAPKLVAQYWIEPGTAIAYTVTQGQYIQIIDVAGSQCSDFLAFANEDFSSDLSSAERTPRTPHQEIDSTVTRTLNGTANPTAGLHSKYFSQLLAPLVEVIQDTCGRHDSFMLACTPRYYEDAGYPGHPSCSDNFNQVLAPYGIQPRLGWQAINFFFNTEITHTGSVLSQESYSRAGDYVLLKAHQNLLCASSACPDDIDPANGWEPTPIHVRIYAADNATVSAAASVHQPGEPQNNNVTACPHPNPSPKFGRGAPEFRLLSPFSEVWEKGLGDEGVGMSLFTRDSPSFSRAIGTRVAADFPLRLTQESAFTPCIRSLTDDLVIYNGFWVPNSFAHQGDQAEYWALRQRAVLIDLSALRKFEVIGADAFALLQYAFSRDLAKLTAGQAAYGCLLNPHGGIVDDGIVFCFGPTHYRYVGNCDTDGDWLRRIAKRRSWQVEVTAVSDRLHNLALQGSKSRDILRSIVTFPALEFQLNSLAYFHFTAAKIDDIPILLSRTGYTGELGYELFVEPQYGAALWNKLMQAGQSAGLQPLGMKALERARIEAGLLAVGSEFDDLISPYQAGIGWAVAMKKPDFIGKAALEKIRLHPPKVAVGLVLSGSEVAIAGQNIYAQGERWRLGHITSATFSPYLGRSVAIAQIVPEYAQLETSVEVGLLDGIKRRVAATVGPLAAFDPQKSRVRA